MSPGARKPAHTVSRKRNLRAAWWLLPVLLLHALFLYGLSRALRTPAPDTPPPVLYTRVLLPQAAPAAGPPTAPAPATATPRSGNPAQGHTATLLERPDSAMHSRAARPAARHRHPAPGAASAAAPRHAAPSPSQVAASASSAQRSPASSPASERAPPQAAPPATTGASAPPRPAASRAAASASQASAGEASAAARDAEAWPASTRLDFALRGYFRGPLHGTGALEWRRDGSRYLLRLSGSALIDFAYTSRGHIDADWLAPEQYVEQVLLRRKTVDFDRGAGVLRFSAMPATLPIPPRLQDSASVFMQLSQALRKHPREFAEGRLLSLEVARPTGTTTWNFRITGRESIETGVGRLDCWHLVYDPPPDADLGAQVWLAPALQDLPVQIRLSHGSDDFLLFTLRRALQ